MYPAVSLLGLCRNGAYRPGDFHTKRADFPVFDMLIVERGCLYMTDGDERYSVYGGDMLVLRAGKPHRSYKACDMETYFHWIHFDTSEKFMYEATIKGTLETNRDFSRKNTKAETLVLPVFQRLPKEDLPNIFHLLEMMEEFTVDKYLHISMIYKENRLKNRLKQQSMFLELMSYLTISDGLPQLNRIAYSIMQYLNANYQQEITLDNIAQIANCHPTHAIRCFSRQYGITPLKALTNIRIEQAKSLLINSNSPITMVAERVGFASASYFSKVFKTNVGLTPQEYRSNTK